MKSHLFTFILIVILFSCSKSSNKKPEKLNKIEKQESPIALSEENTKREYYQTKMREKNFSLNINGPCDDAIEDTLYSRFTTYIDSTSTNDSTVVIQFKFKDACCQEFLGDYHIANDTLKFEFEQVNNEACSCICWYYYKLSIKNFDKNFETIYIAGKR